MQHTVINKTDNHGKLIIDHIKIEYVYVVEYVEYVYTMKLMQPNLLAWKCNEGYRKEIMKGYIIIAQYSMC